MSSDIAAITGSVTAAFGLAKELIQINKAVDEANWKLKLAELTSALADAKVGLAQVRDELENRDKEIARLKEAFKFSAETVRIGDAVYEAKDGKPIGSPFCNRCIAADGFFIKLVELSAAGRPHQCPQCKTNFGHQTRYLYRDQA